MMVVTTQIRKVFWFWNAYLMAFSFSHLHHTDQNRRGPFEGVDGKVITQNQWERSEIVVVRVSPCFVFQSEKKRAFGRKNSIALEQEKQFQRGNGCC